MNKSTKDINNNLDLITRIFENFNKNIIILEGNYKNRESKFKIKCCKCNYIRKTTARMLISFDCPGCKGLGKKNTEIYKKELFKKYNNEYKLIGDYISGTKKVKIKHSVCNNIYEVIAKNVIRNNNPVHCPFCSNNSKITLEKFKNNFFNNLNNSEDFLIMNKNINSGWESYITFKCKKCNKIFKRKASSIRRSNYIKCNNCNPYSNGIFKIQSFLNENKIEFKNEVFFKNLKSKNGNYYKYDIFIPIKNLIIEFDGLQHFQESNKRFSSEVRKRDLIKNNKIKNNSKYSLLRISYKEIEFIDEILKSFLIDKSSTTISKYNLLYLNKNISFNEKDYYLKRSSFKQMNMGDINNLILIDEDIVSTL